MKKSSFWYVTLLAVSLWVFAACTGPQQGTTAVTNQPVAVQAETESTIDRAIAPAETERITPAIQTEERMPVPAVAQDDALTALLAQQEAFVNAYNRINPSVVNIQLVGRGQGSGFVYDTEGHIITNNHVVAGGGTIGVVFSDGSQMNAELVGTDPDSDLAVIKVAELPASVNPIVLADSDSLQVGQIVIAIGNPFGLQGSMTTGIISGLGRLLPSTASSNGGQYNIPDVIQTDAAINPGNSGGPLLDLYGQVIGVNSAIESPVRGSSGIGLAVPANIVSKVAPQLIENGRVAHPWLGISGQAVDVNLAEALDLDVGQRGIFISRVEPSGPADDAGLQGFNNVGSGDVIVGIEGQAIADFDDLLGYVVQSTEVGQTVALQVLRDGELITLSLTMGERPTN